MASADQVLRDCIRDGKLDGKYSNAELRKARDNLPSDSDEYSDCSEVIAAAIKGGSNRGSGAGSPGVGATDPAGEAAARTDDAGDLAAIASGSERCPLGRRRRHEPGTRQQRILQSRRRRESGAAAAAARPDPARSVRDGQWRRRTP